MPHDHNGKELKAGDIVNVPCKVIAITRQGEEECNLTVEPDWYPINGRYKPAVAINSAQVELRQTVSVGTLTPDQKAK